MLAFSVLFGRPALCALHAEPPSPNSAVSTEAVHTSRAVELHDRYRMRAITTREFTHAQIWGALGRWWTERPICGGRRWGRSAEGRPLYLVRYGQGPTRVLLWSQMHGNESTATLALADLFRFLAEAPMIRWHGAWLNA